MSERSLTPREILEELHENISKLIDSYYGLIIIEGDFIKIVNEQSSTYKKKVVISEAIAVATKTREMIEECTKMNKEVEAIIKDFPDDGCKHAVSQHVALRVHVLVNIEAYLISLESKITEMKNEI